jgi:protein-S-isoprenylcysteine O-methyltransferase Ste14
VVYGGLRSGLGDSRLAAEDDARPSRSSKCLDRRDALATASDVIAKDRFHTRTISRRTAFILVWAVGVPLGHVVAPWAISRLSPRYGWETSGPGIWNVTGLMPIATGIAGLIWTMVTAFGQAPERMELSRLPSFLLTRGPYAYSRNPMYASELVLWLGWAVFYGSAGVLIGLVVFFAVLVAAARYEERLLAARFGEVYHAYMESVPRWLGTRRRRN